MHDTCLCYRFLNFIMVQVKFNTEHSRSLSHFQKSSVDNNKARIRNDNMIPYRISKENPMPKPKFKPANTDIIPLPKETKPNFITIGLNKPVQKTQRCRRGYKEHLKLSMKEDNTNTWKRAPYLTEDIWKKISQPKARKATENQKQLLDAAIQKKKKQQRIQNQNRSNNTEESAEWYQEHCKLNIDEDKSNFRLEDIWAKMSQFQARKTTENENQLFDAAIQQIRYERLVKEEHKNKNSRTAFSKMDGDPKVVSPEKEKGLNQERIEAFQEEIIEKEEYVPAFKTFPEEKTLKIGKVRRRMKLPQKKEKESTKKHELSRPVAKQGQVQ